MLKLRTVLHKRINKQGFTLAELLVVVAIIAILVAVSIPIFSGKLTQARRSVDLANERAAKAVAVNEYVSNGKLPGDKVYYDAENGVLVTDKSEIKEGYNQQSKPKIPRKEGLIKMGLGNTEGHIRITQWWEKL